MHQLIQPAVPIRVGQQFSLRELVGKCRRLVPSLLLQVVEAGSRYGMKCSGKVVVGREVTGVKHAEFAGRNSVGFGTCFADKVVVGYATTIGAYNYLVGPVTIGNYCQLGPAVAIYGKEH